MNTLEKLLKGKTEAQRNEIMEIVNTLGLQPQTKAGGHTMNTLDRAQYLVKENRRRAMLDKYKNTPVGHIFARPTEPPKSLSEKYTGTIFERIFISQEANK